MCKEYEVLKAFTKNRIKTNERFITHYDLSDEEYAWHSSVLEELYFMLDIMDEIEKHGDFYEYWLDIIERQ